jgi:zinc protease
MAALLAQTLLQPDYPEDEVERVKVEQLGAISEGDNDTRAVADRLLRRGVYPDPNPLGRRVLGSEQTVGSLDSATVSAFHDRSYRPTGTAIAIVGGLGGFEQTLQHLNDAFGSWNAREEQPSHPDTSRLNDAVVRIDDAIAGKSQADLAVGLATIPRGNDDYYALDVANLILGRLGLMGRLGAEVRDHQGLAYYAFSQIEPRVDGSLWAIRAGVDPTNVERALAAMESELQRLRSEPVTEEELQDAKSYLIGVLPLALETHDGVASTLLAIEEFDLGLDYLAKYPDLISSITRDDVLAAASRHLMPDRLVIAVAHPK